MQLFGLIFFLAFVPLGSALAQQVPAHLATLAGGVYKGSSESIQALRNAASPEKQAIIDQATKAFRRARVGNWSGGTINLSAPFADVARLMDLNVTDTATLEIISGLTTVTGDVLIEKIKAQMGEQTERDRLLEVAAAVDKLKSGGGLATNHSFELETGDEVVIDWSPETAQLVLSARKESGEDSYEFNVPGTVKMETDPESGEPVLVADPSDEQAPRAFTAREIADRIATIFGIWENDTYRMTITGGSDEDGEVRRSKDAISRDIETVRTELDELRNAKEFIWEHPETAELIRQERFRRLGEPWEYKGERDLVPDADEQKAKLEARLEKLTRELSGDDRPTSERLDPVAFEQVKANPNARSLRVSFFDKSRNCLSDVSQAYFDGRRVVARDTHKQACSMNTTLPAAISSELISSWSPPWWLLLRASYDNNGGLQLAGSTWGMYVTYDPDSMSVSRIHDPYASHSLAFTEGGGGELFALGAAETAWP